MADADHGAQALAQRIRRMSAGGQIGLLEVVERVGQHPDLPRREALEQAGARIYSAEDRPAAEAKGTEKTASPA